MIPVLESSAMYTRCAWTAMVILLGLASLSPLPLAGHGPPPGSPQEDDGPFRLEVDVDLVVLNVTVVNDNGDNVTDLTREDFAVFENGIRQDISTFFPVEAPFKLVLLVDTSISTRNNLNLIKDAARNFTKELRPDDQISVTETHFFPQEVQKFTNRRKLLRRAIKRLSTYSVGGSRVYDGVAMALKSLQRTRSGRKAIVVLSDGMENSSRVSFDELRRRLAQDDAVFYPITILNKDRQKQILERYIRESEDKEEDPYVENARLSLSVLEEVYQIQTERLSQLSNETGGKMFLVADLSDLKGEYSKVAHELRHTFSLAYYSNNPATQGGMRRVRVEVRDSSLRARTRTTYFVPETDRAGF